MPSFNNFATEEKDLMLCPYIALKMYFDRTSDRRLSEDTNALFLTYEKGVIKAA